MEIYYITNLKGNTKFELLARRAIFLSQRCLNLCPEIRIHFIANLKGNAKPEFLPRNRIFPSQRCLKAPESFYSKFKRPHFISSQIWKETRKCNYSHPNPNFPSQRYDVYRLVIYKEARYQKQKLLIWVAPG